MKINKHNLEIAKYCAKEMLRDIALNVLHFTKTGTFAACQWFAIGVTGLNPKEPSLTGSMSVEEAKMFESILTDDETMDFDVPQLPLPGKFPDVSHYYSEKPVLFEIVMDLDYMADIIESALAFNGEIVRIQFTGTEDPARWDCVNKKTNQRWCALLMPRTKDLAQDKERFGG